MRSNIVALDTAREPGIMLSENSIEPFATFLGLSHYTALLLREQYPPWNEDVTHNSVIWVH